MKISLILAMDLDGAIGNEGELPWRLSADLRRFRRLTLGKPLIMGRKTFDSIGRPLDRRTNIVITRNPHWSAEGVRVARSPEEALGIAEEEAPEEVMVIGGAEVYRLFLDRAERVYLTEVEARSGGDTRFPLFDPSRWRETAREEHPADDRNEHAQRYRILERR